MTTPDYTMAQCIRFLMMALHVFLVFSETETGVPAFFKMPGSEEVNSSRVRVSNGETNRTTSRFQQDKLAPLVAALKAAAEKDAISFNFPGHNRGQAAPSSLTQIIGTKPFTHDFSGLPELGNSFLPSGPVLEAQKLASKLFGSAQTWFLVGGTTCGVQAAIMATCSPGDYIVLLRNSHISALSGIVLSGAQPKYLIPDYDKEWEIAGAVSPGEVEKSIKELEKEGKRTAAVLITSPTYNGICSNLREMTFICHSHGIPIIVDEAHGAYLGFHPELPSSALQQGVDLVIQSTHKVLSSLTQSSMLHVSGNIVDKERLRKCLQMLQSTSPSYLLLASLDAARAQLSENPKFIFDETIKLAKETMNQINRIPGLQVLTSPSFKNFIAIDPLRITVGVWGLGLSGYEANEFLLGNHGVIAELTGTRSLAFVIHLGTTKESFERLLSGLQNLHKQFGGAGNKKSMEEHGCSPFEDITMGMTPRDAFFETKTRVPIQDSVGKICGEFICPFPPGVPALIPGEVITEKALDFLFEIKRRGGLISGASDPQLSSIICVLS